MVKKSLSTSEMIDSPDKFEVVYKSNLPLIYRFMFWRTKDEMLAEDLTSKIFENAWRRRSTFQGGSAKAWLYKIAHNTLIDYWRKKKDQSADDKIIAQLVSDRESPELALDKKILLTRLHSAIATLPTQMRKVVETRFIQGCSCRETAEYLYISEANVRVIQYRALLKLRDYLHED